MERRDARLFQHDATNEGWNIVELESQRQFRRRIHELIHIANTSTITTSDARQYLRSLQATYRHRLSSQLVRSLFCEDTEERETVVWLLTLLDEPQRQHAIPLLQQITRNKKHPRALRLSASFALAGMGATEEMNSPPGSMRLYAMGC